MPPNFPATSKNKPRRTLMIVVISIVIVIVITIAVVAGFYFWQKNTIIAQVKDELNKIVPAMESKRSETGAYPAVVTDVLASSNSNVKLSGGSSFDGTTYCVTGISTTDRLIIFHIDSAKSAQGPLAGSCETGANIPVPSIPGGLAIAFASSVAIKVTWNSSPHAINYTLQCSTDSNFSNPIATKVTDTTGTCENLKPNTTYYYRVKATNNTGDSAWSSLQRMKTLEN
jgi:hypothetical protein